MAEINNVIAEASQDLQTIEDFVNLPADSEVYPRLLPSVNVGTLAGTRQAIFEAGGLPATPFKTKALMTASPLVDGKYAVVTDDTVNNGLYVKTAGAWVESGYDPSGMAIKYTNNELSNFVYDAVWRGAEFETINDFIIDSNQANTMIKPYAGGKYVKINVVGVSKIRLTNTRNEPTWLLNYVNESDVRTAVSTFYGDGVYVIPAGTKYVYRTIKSTAAVVEPTDFTVESYYPKLSKIVQLSDDLNVEINAINSAVAQIDSNIAAAGVKPKSYNADINPIMGGAVETSSLNPRVLAEGVDRAYLKINVSDIVSAKITGARTDIPAWKWVFYTKDMQRVLISEYSGNASFLIPNNAHYMLRTYKVEGGISENSSINIELTEKQKDFSKINNELSASMTAINKSISGRDYGAIAKMMESAFKRGIVLKLSEFEGATSHIKIDNAIAFIKKRGWGILDLELGVHLRNSAVLVPSNCWIYLNKATLKLADGVFDNVIRNDGIVPNPDPYGYALALNENRNIRIFGVSNDECFVSGADVPYKAPHPIDGGTPVFWTGDWYGWRTLPILFANVKDYKQHDFGVRKPTCWSVTQEHGCSNFEIYNIDIQSRGVKNGDGIDVRMGCSDGDIYNITGDVGDDMVALSAIQNFVGEHPRGAYIYPMQVGGYIDNGHGVDITDINISNVGGMGAHNGVRLLASGGSKMQRISIDDVYDSGTGFSGAMVLVGTGYGVPATTGDIANITANDIDSKVSKTPLQLSAPIQDSGFNNIKQANASGELYNDSAATLTNTTITNARRV